MSSVHDWPRGILSRFCRGPKATLGYLDLHDKVGTRLGRRWYTREDPHLPTTALDPHWPGSSRGALLEGPYICRAVIIPDVGPTWEIIGGLGGLGREGVIFCNALQQPAVRVLGTILMGLELAESGWELAGSEEALEEMRAALGDTKRWELEIRLAFTDELRWTP